MLTLPQELMKVILPFATLFSETVWDYAQILLIGAILAPGKRTVSAALTVIGLKDDPQYQNYHRVLNRATWCSLTAGKILLGLLVPVFVAANVPIVLGVDETLERRQGKQIKQKGVFRDPVRSSKKYLVHSFGLRWVSMMLMVSVPWSRRPWALPFLTLNAPSEATNQANGRRHKTSIDWIQQMVCLVRRWLRGRLLVLVTDGGLTAVKLGLTCGALRQPVVWVSRLRLDARLHAWPGKQPKSKRGPKPKKGRRLQSLQARVDNPHTPWQKKEIEWYGGRTYTIEYVTGKALWYTPGFDPLPIRWVLVRDPAAKYETTAFLCTDLTAKPLQILHWFILRWNVEVTFQEARALLGLETQRQWSDLAIARTTPLLLGLFSLVTLLAYHLTRGKPFPIRTSAWYVKEKPTFSDALAVVRRQIWFGLWGKYIESTSDPDYILIPTSVFNGLVDSMCYTT
ncbi:MAG: transposase [Ketobacter sp.]|nr:transposase [Ketobacter sp.]